jgi:hypothetical protein
LETPDAESETLRQDVEAVAHLHDAPVFFLLGEECGEGGWYPVEARKGTRPSRQWSEAAGLGG